MPPIENRVYSHVTGRGKVVKMFSSSFTISVFDERITLRVQHVVPTPLQCGLFTARMFPYRLSSLLLPSLFGRNVTLRYKY